jgi:mRNA interferase YafQ
MALFKHVNELLVAGEQLPVKNRDHILTGNWNGHRECHIEPDWLLIYRVNEVEKEIEYVRMGSHADLF